LSLPGALVIQARVAGWLGAAAAPLTVLFVYGTATAAVHLAALVTPHLRRPPFRIGVSIPGMTFISAGFLCGVWLLALRPGRGVLALLGGAAALPALRPLDLVPLVIALGSVVPSVRVVEGVVRVPLAGDGPSELTRLPVTRRREGAAAPLADRP